jgi:hypothetical protein
MNRISLVCRKSIASARLVNSAPSLLSKNLRLPASNYRLNVIRSFSSPQGGNEAPAKTTDETSDKRDIAKMDYDDYDDYEPKTAGQKVAFYTAVGFRLGLLVLAGVCIYFTASELFPGRLNPNGLFSEVFDLLKDKHEVSFFFIVLPTQDSN